MILLRIGLLGLAALVTCSCSEQSGPRASESLSDAIVSPVGSDERGPMLCIDSVAVHINDHPWKRSELVWSTTDHARIVAIVHAVRMPFEKGNDSQDNFVTARDDVRIFFVCREEGIFASVRVLQPRDRAMRWRITDGTVGTVWDDRGALEAVVLRFGIARAAGIE